MLNMLHKLVLTGLLGLSLFVMSGCLEEKDTVTVYPNGSGTIHLHRKFGEQLSEMLTSYGDKNNPQATLDKSLYEDLTHWTGVTTWTGCKAAMDGKCLVTEATGYFDDVSKLQMTDGKNTQSFSWAKNLDGGVTLAWNNDNKSDQNPFEAGAPSAEQNQQILSMMKGLKVEHEIILPGTIVSLTGCGNRHGRSASSIITYDDVSRYIAMLDDYRKRVDKGDLTKAQAYAEIKQKSAALSMRMQAVCAPGDTAAEVAQFRKDYAKAKADYASSGIPEKIQAAKKSGADARP